MNARAGKLVAALRGIASTLPRTNGIGFYVSVTFGLVPGGCSRRRRPSHHPGLGCALREAEPQDARTADLDRLISEYVIGAPNLRV